MSYQLVVFALCRDLNLPQPTPEFRFHATRRWKFDFAWPEQKFALEVEGGIFNAGGKHSAHGSITGILRDMEKYNAATIDGWRVIRTLPKAIPEGINLIKILFEN